MQRLPATARRTAAALLLVASVTLAGCAAPRGMHPPRLQDPPLAGYVQQLACRIADPCRRYPVVLLDLPQPQAELHPDGRIAVRLGLLLSIADEAELVFVLAHEIAHRQLRHRPTDHAGDRLALELAADAAAVQALLRLGYPIDAGRWLIERLAARAVEDEAAAAQVAARLAALPPAATVPAGEAGHAQPLDTLLARYRR